MVVECSEPGLEERGEFVAAEGAQEVTETCLLHFVLELHVVYQELLEAVLVDQS